MALRASGWAPVCTGSRTESAASPGHPAPEYVLDRGCKRRGDAAVPFRGEVKRIEELVRSQQVVQVDVRQPALRGVRLRTSTRCSCGNRVDVSPAPQQSVARIVTTSTPPTPAKWK